MGRKIPYTPISKPPRLSVERMRAVRCAVVLLGADPDSARRMSLSETVGVGMVGLCVRAIDPEPDGAWIASARLRAPSGVSAADWCEALLVANSRLMLLGDSAFGLEPDGDGCAFVLLPPDERSPHVLAAYLEGLLLLCSDVTWAASASFGNHSESRAVP